MKPSNKDRVDGNRSEMKGKVKEEPGEATNNLELVDEGQHEKASAKAQKKAGLVKKAVFGK